MSARTTLVTSLPRLARDFSWSAHVASDDAATKPVPLAEPCRVEYIRIDAAKLAGELEAELRKVIDGASSTHALDSRGPS
ncbi:MAG: hypothetical protein QM775_36710 [Pirellulales bacterium]